jgi:hypothetical protein
LAVVAEAVAVASPGDRLAARRAAAAVVVRVSFPALAVSALKISLVKTARPKQAVTVTAGVAATAAVKPSLVKTGLAAAVQAVAARLALRLTAFPS